MRSAILIGVTAALVAALGCANYKVYKEVDEQWDFSKYQTFDWAHNTYNKEDHPVANFELVDSVVRDLARRQLEEKGFRPADPPDFLLSFYIVVQEKPTYDQAYDAFYGFRWRYNDFGIQTDPFADYQVGSLIIDIHDAKSLELKWRGWATGVVKENLNMQRELHKAVHDILDSFPPAQD